MIKQIIVVVSSMGIGGCIGYVFARKMLEERYQYDIAEVRKLYQDKLDELDAMIEAIDKGNPDITPKEENETPEEKEIREVISTYRGERRRSVIEYNKPSLESFKQAAEDMYHEDPSPVDPDGNETLGEDNEEEEPNDPEYEAELDQQAEEYARRRSENMRSNLPYLIEPEEYREGPEDYDHQTLYYYADDRTLCEDDDTEVDDEEECVGFDYEDKLDMQTTCWVRNDKLRVLYEIHRIDDSYSAAVKNVSETPREREFRLQGRRKNALDNK